MVMICNDTWYDMIRHGMTSYYKYWYKIWHGIIRHDQALGNVEPTVFCWGKQITELYRNTSGLSGLRAKNDYCTCSEKKNTFS